MQLGDRAHVLRDFVQDEPDALDDQGLVSRHGRGTARDDALQRGQVALERPTTCLDRTMALELLLVVGSPVKALGESVQNEHLSSLSRCERKVRPGNYGEKGKKESQV